MPRSYALTQSVPADVDAEFDAALDGYCGELKDTMLANYDATGIKVHAFNPDQSRAPAGSPNGGEWVSGGAGGGESEREGTWNADDKKLLNKWWMHFSDEETQKARSGNMMNGAFSRAPRYDGEVYRGLSLTDKEVKWFKEGKGVTIALHSSSAIDPEDANIYAARAAYDRGADDRSPVIMKLSVQSAPNISSVTKNSGEIILTKGTAFRVTKVTRESMPEWKPEVDGRRTLLGRTGKNVKVTVIHMEQR